MTTYTDGDKIALDAAFDKVLTGAGGLKTGLFPNVFTDLYSGSITTPLTLYVSATGDDSGDGSVLRPFRQPSAAIEYLKRLEIASVVNISIGAGSFEGFAISGIDISQAVSTAKLTISGTTSAEITGTCTTTTSEGLTVITDSSKTWTTNQHRGKIVSLIVGSTTVNAVCWTNTSTQLYLVANSTGYTSYSILSLDTVLTPLARNGGTGSVFFNGASRGFGSLANITIQLVRCTGSVIFRGGSGVVRESQIAASTCVSAFNGAGQLISCSLVAAGACISHANAGSPNMYLLLTGVFCSGLFGVSWVGFGSLITSIVAIAATDTGIFMSNGQWLNQSGFPCNISGAITGVALSNGVLGNDLVLTGSGNTTAISLTKGGKMLLRSTATITGTTEINVDGVTSTLTALRALSPKVFPATANPYGSYIYE